MVSADALCRKSRADHRAKNLIIFANGAAKTFFRSMTVFAAILRFPRGRSELSAKSGFAA
jgi:hypothetical protein